MKLRWLITGAAGMVGADVVRQLEGSGDEVVALRRSELDVTEGQAVRQKIAEVRPTVILNCAAYTRVDDAEREEEAATAVNGEAVEHLAAAADDVGALFAHISSDFVFDGRSSTPYEPSHPTAPLSAYGRSKLAGEIAAQRAAKHLIVRSSWLFGVEGNNFVEAIRRQLDGGKETLRVVDDQRGCPTYTPHLAAAVIRLSRLALESPEPRGVAHYADEPAVSWFEFARAIVDTLEMQDLLLRKIEVQPVSSAEFPRAARRPTYSVLSTRRYQELTGAPPGSWQKGLEEYLKLRPS